MGGETTMAVNAEIMAEFPSEVVAEVTPILAKIAPLLEEVVPLLNELPEEIMLMMTSAIQASMVRIQLVKKNAFGRQQSCQTKALKALFDTPLHPDFIENAFYDMNDIMNDMHGDMNDMNGDIKDMNSDMND
jgi:hypothetical protein